MRHQATLLLLSMLGLSACTTAPSAPPAPTYRAPWADLGKIEFPYLLAAYGTANVPLRREEALDNYLRSQTKTFDRYIAAKEVGLPLATFQNEALPEIQQRSQELTTKRFVVSTQFEFQNYDAALGGFPIFSEPFDRQAGLHYFNEDVRSSPSKDRKTYGVSVAAKDYGFMEAQIWFPKVGWVLPATPDQATRLLEALSRTGSNRKIAVAMVYSVERCNQDDGESTRLICEGTIQNLYGYDSPASVRDLTPPLVELVNRRR